MLWVCPGFFRLTFPTQAWVVGMMFLVGSVGASEGESKREKTLDAPIRALIFEGFTGKIASLREGKEQCEEILEKDPDHPEALAWHGAILVWLAAQSFEENQALPGMMMLNSGLKEWDRSLKLAPHQPGVRVPRVAVYPKIARSAPATMRKPLWEKARNDFLWLMENHKEGWGKLSEHARGELLIGYAETERALGNRENAERTLARILVDLPQTPYAKLAREWSDSKATGPRTHNCIGCHK